MTTTATNECERVQVTPDSIIELPLGLLGFEGIKKYVLLSNPGEEPFLWLQMMEAPNHSFLVVPPSAVNPEYRPELSEDDVRFLGLAEPDDALVVNIVTIRVQGKSTVNLKGPLVVNRRTRIGKQVIPLNAGRYPLQHPLPEDA